MDFFWVRKKVHWGDCDAAQVVWFPRFMEWFEEAEEELFAALGRPRQALLEQLDFGMPRVELHTTFYSPARAAELLRIGIASTVENPRRIRHAFEVREDESDRLIASGFVRVGCVGWTTFRPRDLPPDVVRLFDAMPDLIARQSRGDTAVPWT